ncbi:MAG: tol-pal system protein YbgF [Pseudomonadota bacterium]
MAVAVAVVAVGCGAPKRVDQSLTNLEKTSAQLRSENEELRKRLEDLSSEVLVLQDRLETLKIHVEREPEALPRLAKTTKAGVKNVSGKTQVAQRKEILLETEEEEPFLTRNNPRDSKLPTLQLSNRDLARVEKRGAAASPTTPTAAKTTAPVPSEPAGQRQENPEATKAYNEAFKKYEDGNFKEAIAALGQFADHFQTHTYADNAVFWIGESFFKMQDYQRAAAEFERVVTEFPGGNKVPDAMLRVGDCYVRLSRPEEALKAYEKIISAYPRSVAAEKARAWISEYSAQAGKGRM